jgi:hypothetical protein
VAIVDAVVAGAADRLVKSEGRERFDAAATALVDFAASFPLGEWDEPFEIARDAARVEAGFRVRLVIDLDASVLERSQGGVQVLDASC